MNTLTAVLPRRVLPPLWREAGAIREGWDVIRHSPQPPLRELPPHSREVLLVPGFLAGDSSMRLLAGFLHRARYVTVSSGIARNVDCSEATLRRLESLLERRTQDGGQLSIVGHSRGGLLARALASRRPDLVSGVVTLGSPVRDQLAVHPLLWTQILSVAVAGSSGATNTMTLGCATGPCCARYRTDLEAPLAGSVPLLSVYSRRDGVVDWRSCRDRDGESVEVTATHLGMVAQAATFRVVLGALDRFVFASAAARPHAEPTAAVADGSLPTAVAA
jgi:triacylglycerol lipase